ncbi:hypothetical protein FUAX_13230 [Fulvitalea axinellae]|uniref:Oxalate:formate antiporter n=1 Tax=Fulvitalea axinellae TaxID=1182444 RepID=A0AAU9D7P1_9BACT|nr:hypothetical protein FUAX_13230 [Fulvitalea axinellae]
METQTQNTSVQEVPTEKPVVKIALSWAFVGIPLAYGISQTIIKAMALFI